MKTQFKRNIYSLIITCLFILACAENNYRPLQDKKVELAFYASQHSLNSSAVESILVVKEIEEGKRVIADLFFVYEHYENEELKHVISTYYDLKIDYKNSIFSKDILYNKKRDEVGHLHVLSIFGEFRLYLDYENKVYHSSQELTKVPDSLSFEDYIIDLNLKYPEDAQKIKEFFRRQHSK